MQYKICFNFNMWIFKSCFVFAILIYFCKSKSAKKGVCIPPGTNFHCGDLAAFNNIRSGQGKT